MFQNSKIQIATLYNQIPVNEGFDNPNIVKLVIDKFNKVLYFSRANIPFDREGNKQTYLKKHIGLYAFTKNTLLEIIQLETSNLETTEMLEQLRWLESGYSIYAQQTDYQMMGIDTKEDLEKAKPSIN
jgi:3-deoxy-manno-octulosonate cytidylyltransferase (CMP-KDO synthetase)